MFHHVPHSYLLQQDDDYEDEDVTKDLDDPECPNRVEEVPTSNLGRSTPSRGASAAGNIDSRNNVLYDMDEETQGSGRY